MKHLLFYWSYTTQNFGSFCLCCLTEIPQQRLTSETLKEHNKRFSPVNKLLWRSLDNEPKQPPTWDQDPYYSDSEIEINGRSRRRSSLHRCGTTAGELPNQYFTQIKSIYKMKLI